MMRDSRDAIESGDQIETYCNNCGDRYKYTEGFDDHPPRGTTMCPDCYPTHEAVRSAMVAGTWTVRDEDFREIMVEMIRESTPYDVWVTGNPNPNRLYVYDPDEVDL